MYDISKNRYRELKYFCLQYKEMKAMIKWLQEKDAGKGIDPTADTAVPLADYIKASRLIEKTAFDTDEKLGSMVLKSVTEDVSLSRISLPSNKNPMDDLRHKFFYLLDKRKGL